MSNRPNPAAGKTFTPEEQRRIVAELSVMAALRESPGAPAATADEMFMIAELVRKLLLILRMHGRVRLFGVGTPEELIRLIDGLDALYRETGQASPELRETLVTAAYGKLPEEVKH